MWLEFRRVLFRSDRWGPGGKHNILILSPPPIREEILTHPLASANGGGMGQGCVEKSNALAAQYRQVALQMGVHFLDAGEMNCEMNSVDFMHLSKAGHAALARALADRIPDMVL